MEAAERVEVNGQAGGDRGKGLFLRYAEGCWMYRHDKGLVSESDNSALESGNPSYDVLKRVFYVALPSMESIAKRLGKAGNVFHLDVLREFYSGEHNERKFREGELACLAFPARVLEKRPGSRYLIGLEPVAGSFEVGSDLDLEPGDWAVMHRISLVEKVPEGFAMDMAERLRKLGLDKTYKFPKVAIKYLKALKSRRYDGRYEKDKVPSDAGKGEAPQAEGRPEEAPVKRPGEAHA